MSLFPTSEQWKGSKPIFFLEINYNGKIYRPSTDSLTILSNEGNIVLQGGMTEEPDFEQEISELGFNVSSYSTSFSLYLQNIDVTHQHMNENRLENCKAELCYILVKQQSIEAYEARKILLRGVIKEPIFGFKDRSSNYVQFSIESEVLELSFHDLTVGSGARISSEDLTDLVNPTFSTLSTIQDANFFLEVLELHKGKILPLVFGEPGNAFNKDYGAISYPSTPAYVIYATHGAGNQIWLAVAPHDVDASTVRIYDDLGNNRVETIKKWIRRDGRIFSFVEFTHSSGGFQNPVQDESSRYFVSWNNGGGYISPTQKTILKGGGDICLFCLSQGNQNIDFAAWESLKDFLNQYEFGGYITNTEITPLEFLQNEIIPFLPISVIQGINGMKPVLDILASGVKPIPTISILANEEFSNQSGIQRIGDTSRLINHYSLEYSFDIKHDEHRNKITLTGDTSIISNEIMTNSQAQSSFNQYGALKKTETSSFVVDFNTASLICFDKIRKMSLPIDYIQYQVSPRYGFLEVGDIIELTDNDLSFDKKIVQIVSKIWNVSIWQLRLRIIPSEIT